jgi:hypothetical protein
MKRSIWTLTLIAVAVLVALPVLAAGPTATKNVTGGEDGIAVVEIHVTASGESLYGVNITDASGSIKDIIAPKGWIGISSGDEVMFRTGKKPIVDGDTVTFRLMTTNEGAGLSVRFRDELKSVGSAKTL